MVFDSWDGASQLVVVAAVAIFMVHCGFSLPDFDCKCWFLSYRYTSVVVELVWCEGLHLTDHHFEKSFFAYRLVPFVVIICVMIDGGR